LTLVKYESFCGLLLPLLLSLLPVRLLLPCNIRQLRQSPCSCYCCLQHQLTLVKHSQRWLNHLLLLLLLTLLLLCRKLLRLCHWLLLLLLLLLLRLGTGCNHVCCCIRQGCSSCC
jgi:hypothetical protein